MASTLWNLNALICLDLTFDSLRTRPGVTTDLLYIIMDGDTRRPD